jgi:Large ribosomal RNA subunit accumulation protein YceD
MNGVDLLAGRENPLAHRENALAEKENPWSVAVTVAQIPEHGLHRDIEASASERDAMAALAGLRGISSAHASLDITPIRDGRVHVVGRVLAQIGQTCVVSLDPIDSAIDEAIDLIFAPASQIRELAESIEDTEGDAEIPDPPEPIVGGVIDLGRLATDALFLGINPYPRKPDAVFEPPAEHLDPEDHPFAALKTLKSALDSPGSKKPKGR